MSTWTILRNFYSLPQFWRDVKDLKREHIKDLRPNFDLQEDASELEKLKNYPFLESICNYIDNNYESAQKNHVPYDRQPFVTQGIRLWKLDWATDRKGSSGGLRILYYVQKSEDSIYMVLIKKKSECANEKRLMEDVLNRTKSFFTFT